MTLKTTSHSDHSEWTSVLPTQINKLGACLANKQYEEAEHLTEVIGDAIMRVRAWIMVERCK